VTDGPLASNSVTGAIRYTPIVSGTLIGYARCSTDTQDLTAQRDRLRELGVAGDRIYLHHGLTGTSRKRPGLDNRWPPSAKATPSSCRNPAQPRQPGTMTCWPSDDPGRPRPHIRWAFGAWTRYPLAVPLLLEPGYWAGIPARPRLPSPRPGRV
jgi:hypothetical protein